MVRLLVAALPASGSAPSSDTAGLDCVEITLFDSKAKVVSPAAMVAVLPVFVLVGVVVVVVVVVVAVATGATQFTAVSVVVQVVRFDRLFSVLLTQPDMLVAATNNEKP